MSNRQNIMLTAFMGFAVGMSFFKILSLGYQVEMKQEAIQRGFAEYNQQTGEWQWKEDE